MLQRLTDKIAVVTGANGGLGVHVTRAFLDAGATVVGISPDIRAEDFNHAYFVAMPAEIRTLDSARRVVEEAVGRFRRIDFLAHLVGGFAGGQSVAETDDATFQRMLEMNLLSTFHMLRAVLPTMRRQGAGRIVAIGSRAAEDPGPGVGAYSASKAAVVSLVRTVARENKDAGITANVLLPGTMDTPANRKAMPKEDFSKWVQPASVASLILWLCGEGGKDVNGAVIPVYGAGL